MSTNDPANPLSKQAINLRCHYNKKNLFDIQRYVRGYKGLRPGNEQLVIYGAIVGVPPDLVDERGEIATDGSATSARDIRRSGPSCAPIRDR